MNKPLIVIKGAGDLATGIGWRLQRAGFPVMMTEIAQPLTVRLTVAFSQAVYTGKITVEGITAELATDAQQVKALLDKGKIAVIVDPQATIIQQLRPVIVIDAIMAKRNINTTIDDAPLVIAIGPGFCAGKDCHYVIETKRGHYLGKVIEQGTAIANTGVPGDIGGYTTERIIRSAGEGRFTPAVAIGTMVKQGDIIAYTDKRPIIAQLSGIVRGMLHEDLWVTDGMKCGDIDPRAAYDHCFTISDKSRAIGGGALEAVLYGLTKLSVVKEK